MARPKTVLHLRKRWTPGPSTLTRKEINAFISECTKKLDLRSRYQLEVAMGGRRSASGVYQGEDTEGFPWGGDFASLTTVRKLALPGDLLDVYVNDAVHGNLIGNVFIRIPYAELGIQGECGWY